MVRLNLSTPMMPRMASKVAVAAKAEGWMVVATKGMAVAKAVVVGLEESLWESRVGMLEKAKMATGEVDMLGMAARAMVAVLVVLVMAVEALLAAVAMGWAALAVVPSVTVAALVEAMGVEGG